MQENPDSLLGRHNLSSENSNKTASSHKAFLEVWKTDPSKCSRIGQKASVSRDFLGSDVWGRKRRDLEIQQPRGKHSARKIDKRNDDFQPDDKQHSTSKPRSCTSHALSLHQEPDDTSPGPLEAKERRRVTVLEVFSGSGTLSGAFREQGACVIGSLDIKHGPHHDLTRRTTQKALCAFLSLGLISYAHFGSPCTAFSIARKGLKNMRQAKMKEKIGCELAFLTVLMIEICFACGTSWSLENPATSMLWELWPIKQLMMRDDVFVIDFPMCAYGTAFKKMTRLITNNPALCSLQRQCRHKKHAQQLVGRVKVVKSDGTTSYHNRTELAGAYPQKLAETWASIVMHSALHRHDQEECFSASDTFNEWLNQAFEDRRNQQIFDLTDCINTQFPKLAQQIIFGQDSAAVKAQKRKRREKAEACWKKFCHQVCQRI